MEQDRTDAKLVCIVTEAALENQLLREIEAAGILAYTVGDVRGRGLSGLRRGTWDASANIRVEAVCAAAAAETVIAKVKSKFGTGYALFIYTADATIR